eukprot:g13529.t1
MAVPRRRPGYKYAEATSTPFRRHPDMQHPPDGYSLIEADLHRATTSLEVASFPFLSQLKLRSAINLSAEAIHDQAIQFFLDSGVAMLNPRALEAFDGPYDLWEEAAKESLELLLDADNHPMLLLDSPTECESACLVGCLRRLQHWSMVAIHDEYHMLTMRTTWYSTSQHFIERFDLDLVTLTANLPPWYRNHLTMLAEERAAEAELSRRDPDRPTRLWVHGHGAFSASVSSPPPPSDELQEEEDKGDKEAEPRREDPAGGGSSQSHTQSQPSTATTQSQSQSQSSGPVSDEQRKALASSSNPSEGRPHTGVAGIADADVDTPTKTAQYEHSQRGVKSEQDSKIGVTSRGDAEKSEEGEVGKSAGMVPDFRLDGFVHACPLVSEGCKFTAKAWLQDEDD